MIVRGAGTLWRKSVQEGVLKASGREVVSISIASKHSIYIAVLQLRREARIPVLLLNIYEHIILATITMVAI